MAPARTQTEETYDYIVVGGGTSGCVVAGRLAEDSDARILVLEAGPDSADQANVHAPGAWALNLEKETDWNVVSEPMAGVNNRQVKMSRGKVLGGCSGINGTLCIRGTKQDYDDWGIEGWTGEEVWKYMSKAETFHDKDWFHPSKAHGHTGPLHTAPHDNAPISNLIMESFIDRGLPFHEDMFSTGETPVGCGHAIRTIHEGLRTTAADFITKTYRRKNIDIQVETLVDKLIFGEDSGELAATGVEIIRKDGTRATAHARKEVILSASAYMSPAILLRSGIGPAADLSKLGIDVKVDLPGVGQNLMDHVISFIFYEVDEPGLTLDHLAYHGDGAAKSYQLYQDSRTGLFSAFPFGSFAYTRVDERLKDHPLWKEATAKAAPGRDAMDETPSQPHVEIWNTELYGGPLQYTDFPVNEQFTFSMVPMLTNPRSRGRVWLKSADPTVYPAVDHAYLSDPLDVLVMEEAALIANEVATLGKGTKAHIKGSWPEGLTHHKNTKREDWKEYIKETATTCYHHSGTCKMGKASDPLAVVDERLRVRGVKNLRVVDVSVMPRINNGHTQMPAYAIGEKAADLIKQDAKASNA